VTWARAGAGFTRSFEDQVAWLAANATQSVVGQLMRVAWRTVGRVLKRVVDEQVCYRWTRVQSWSGWEIKRLQSDGAAISDIEHPRCAE